MSSDVTEILKQFGIAAPLLGVLMYLLRQSNEERREITQRFLATLDTTIKSSADAATRVAAATTQVQQTATAEHEKIVTLLQEVARRLERTQPPARSRPRQADRE